MGKGVQGVVETEKGRERKRERGGGIDAGHEHMEREEGRDKRTEQEQERGEEANSPFESESGTPGLASLNKNANSYILNVEQDRQHSQPNCASGYGMKLCI